MQPAMEPWSGAEALCSSVEEVTLPPGDILPYLQTFLVVTTERRYGI